MVWRSTTCADSRYLLKLSRDDRLNVRSKLASVVWARSNDWPLRRCGTALYVDKLAVMPLLHFQAKL